MLSLNDAIRMSRQLFTLALNVQEEFRLCFSDSKLLKMTICEEDTMRWTDADYFHHEYSLPMPIGYFFFFQSNAMSILLLR